MASGYVGSDDAWDRTFGVEFAGLHATTAGVDISNTVGAFGTLNGVFLVQLDDPMFRTTPIPFRNQYDVRTLHWNKVRGAELACSSNNKVYVWDTQQVGGDAAGAADGGAHVVLNKHVRTVNDIEWQAQSAFVLASCSYDSYVYVWDTREPSSEQRAFTSYKAEKTDVLQIAWNRSDGNVLASTHGGSVRIWDMRFESLPVKTIRAHESDIYGIDWSYTNEAELVTCAKDKVVKFWNVNNPSNFVDYIQSSAPIRRAKFTPFGDGLVTVSASTEKDMKLWSRADLRAPVHVFNSTAITTPPSDFVFRYDADRLQLLSWSESQLRFWACPPDLLASIGHTPALASASAPATTPPGRPPVPPRTAMSPAPPSPAEAADSGPGLTVVTSGFGGITSPTASPCFVPEPGSDLSLLQQEVNYLTDHPVPDAKLEMFSPAARQVLINFSAAPSSKSVRVRLVFPLKYPVKGPTISFVQRSNYLTTRGADTAVGQELKLRLRELASVVVLLHEREDKPSLLATVSEIATQFALLLKATPTTGPGVAAGGATMVASSFMCPRLGGAFFGPDGTLVTWHCFSAGLYRAANPNHRADGEAGAAADERAGMGATWPTVWADLTLSLELEQQGRMLHRGDEKRVAVSSMLASALDGAPTISGSVALSGADLTLSGDTKTRVRLVSAARWILASPALAAQYAIPSRSTSLEAVCTHNAAVAAAADRPDLVRVFSLCAIMLDRYTPAKLSQTLGRAERHAGMGTPWSTHPFTRATIESLLAHFSTLGDVQTLAMLSCIFAAADAMMARADPGGLAPPLLSGDLVAASAAFRNGYCILLDAWSLPVVRAEVAKFNVVADHAASPFNSDIVMANTCIRVRGSAAAGPLCFSCPRPHFMLRCAVCRRGVKGLSTACLRCGHGGHVACLRSWYATDPHCPTGCGCACLAHHNLQPQTGRIVD